MFSTSRNPKPILRLLALISDVFDWLNYQPFYDARYQLINPLKPAWKNIAYTPYSQIASSAPTGRAYFRGQRRTVAAAVTTVLGIT